MFTKEDAPKNFLLRDNLNEIWIKPYAFKSVIHFKMFH